MHDETITRGEVVLWPRLAALVSERFNVPLHLAWRYTFRDLQWMLDWKNVDERSRQTRMDRDRVVDLEEHIELMGMDLSAPTPEEWKVKEVARG